MKQICDEWHVDYEAGQRATDHEHGVTHIR